LESLYAVNALYDVLRRKARALIEVDRAFIVLGRKMAARLGVEPRQNESESFVLPLHHRAVSGKNIIVPGRSEKTAGARLKNGAGDGIRTRNRLFTKQVLYR
jgi:hypothetical protein